MDGKVYFELRIEASQYISGHQISLGHKFLPGKCWPKTGICWREYLRFPWHSCNSGPENSGNFLCTQSLHTVTCFRCGQAHFDLKEPANFYKQTVCSEHLGPSQAQLNRWNATSSTHVSQVPKSQSPRGLEVTEWIPGPKGQESPTGSQMASVSTQYFWNQCAIVQ